MVFVTLFGKIFIDYLGICFYNLIRTSVRYRYHERRLEILDLSVNEVELLGIIRENDNPEQALVTAVEVISGCLAQHGSSGGQAAADPQGLGETS